MTGWHHQCNRHELGQTSGDGEEQGGWHAAIFGVAKSRTWLGDWATIRMLEQQNHLKTKWVGIEGMIGVGGLGLRGMSVKGFFSI